MQNLSNCVVVGKGYTSDVYSWGEGRVLKLFNPGVARTKAEREFEVTRAVYAAGLPVPETHELVVVEGREGIVFERVEGVSLFNEVQSKPWKLWTAVAMLAEVHAQIHTCTASADLPSQREWLASGIDAAKRLSATNRRAARRCLDELPDGEMVCHGDFHPGNIIVSPRGPVVIDWGRATRGHPLGDVACTSHLMEVAELPPWVPRFMHLLLKVSRRQLLRTYLNEYLRLRSGSRREINAWRVPLRAAASGWPMQDFGLCATSD